MEKADNPAKTRSLIENDEIDILAVIKTIWDGRKYIYYSIGIFLLLGIIVSYSSTTKYKATATLLPSTERSGSNLGELGALAGMAGLNLNTMMGKSSGIPPDVYQQIINSYPFLKEMIHQKFNFPNKKDAISIYDYVVSDTIETFTDKVKKYTVYLPRTIKTALTKPITTSIVEPDYGVLSISKEEALAISRVQGQIIMEIDERTDLITISAEITDPVLAAQFVQKAHELLQAYIIEYKTKQARENLAFIQESFDENKIKYQKSQVRLLEYKDANRNLISERINMSYQELNDEFELVSNVYKGLGQQLEQAKIAVKESTPVFTVIEPVQIPTNPSKPNKKLIMALSIVLGGFVGVGTIFGRIAYFHFKTKLG